MQPLLIALQFLTRLPIRLSAMPSDRAISQSLLYYPVVGLLIGSVLMLLAWLMASIPTTLAAAVLLISWVLLTGGLHLDGLADSADAWAGGLGDREKTLTIMKDPRCGPAGVVSLVLVLLLKFSALQVIIDSGQWTLLLLAPLLGRTSLPLLFLTTPYVRPQGLGSALTAYLPRTHIKAVIAVVLVGLLWGLGTHALWAILAAIAVFLVVRTLAMRRIGGTTGDVAGALAEIIEASVLLVVGLSL